MTSLFGTWRICLHFRPLHDHASCAASTAWLRRNIP